MKQVLLIVNIILVAAIGVLFYLYSDLKKNIGVLGAQTQAVETPKVFVANNATALKDAKIAYINIDSLSMNYQYITDNSKVIDAEKNALEENLRNLYANFQGEYQALQESYQAGIKPEAELQKEAEVLERKRQDIAMKEKQLQNLNERTAQKQAAMLQHVSDFIAKFNNNKFDYILATTSNISSVLYAKPGLNITRDILTGLNDEYKAEKVAAAAKPKK